jgi:hypothetical protein
VILNPAILALISASLLTSALLLYASFYAVRILRGWDLKSGSENQLLLERRTYLISTILSYVMALQLGSLFLYIYTAESLHNLFVGAMCAAGTLYANAFGYPTFLFKIFNFILAGLWLILNYTDNKAYDYPLIRKKNILLLIITPLVLAEAIMQTYYFLGLKGDIITSCCGSLFSSEKNGIGSDMAAVPVKWAMGGFYGSLLLTLGLGMVYWVKGRWGGLFSFSSGISFLIFSLSLISFISLYFYELPTHHCPFCILQKEYYYSGYLIYGSLLAGVVSGLGVGVLLPFQGIKSLSPSLPGIQKRLTLVCLASYFFFALLTMERMIHTDFSLGLVWSWL